MHIKDGSVVFIHFKLWDGEGNLLDQSADGEPLAYLHGAAGIVPGLEEELSGKAQGEAFDVTIDPDDAYGEHMAEAVLQMPRSQFPEDLELAPGMQFTNDAGGSPVPLRVTAVGPDYVTVDTNHPLAGLTLRFQGSVVGVREASAEELEQIGG